MAVASLLKSQVRASDVACRYGGEEFVLVLPGADLDSAASHAEQLRQMCAELVTSCEGIPLSVTLSLGVASFPAHGTAAEEILIKADRAMYQSKHDGRNRVTAWDGSIENVGYPGK